VAAELVLLSPLDGWAAPLAEVPDPVFAEAMLGDGVAIDPTSAVLHAPCDAVVINVHASRHAVSLRAAGGLELLLHVGLETVALNGEGFAAQVAEGQQVRAGDPLLSFDLELLARRATSLISPLVITTLGDHAISARISGRRVAAGDPLITLTAVTPTPPPRRCLLRLSLPAASSFHCPTACTRGLPPRWPSARGGSRPRAPSPAPGGGPAPAAPSP